VIAFPGFENNSSKYISQQVREKPSKRQSSFQLSTKEQWSSPCLIAIELKQKTKGKDDFFVCLKKGGGKYKIEKESQGFYRCAVLHYISVF
jgi:hypothetical protein